MRPTRSALGCLPCAPLVHVLVAILFLSQYLVDQANAVALTRHWLSEHEWVDRLERLTTEQTARTSGAMAVTLRDGTLFTARAMFGGQSFDLTLDTGSGGLWVTGDACETKTCKSHPRYSPGASRTYRGTNEEFSLDYVSGGMKGELAYETVTIHSENDPEDSIVIENQLFGVATEVNGNVFDTPAFSGVMGLGYPRLSGFSVKKGLPFFDNVMKSNALSLNAFSFVLNRKSPKFMFGPPDARDYNGDLSYLPVTQRAYWTVSLEDILVDGQSLGFCSSSRPCKAIFDTGASYMSVPSRHLRSMVRALTGETADRPCSESNRTITYVFSNGISFELSPRDYLKRSVNGEFCRPMFSADDVEDPYGPAFVVGDVFFARYFVLFDRTNNRIGLAQARVYDEDPVHSAEGAPSNLATPGLRLTKFQQSRRQQTVFGDAAP